MLLASASASVCANDFGLYTPTNGIQIQGFDYFSAAHISYIAEFEHLWYIFAVYIIQFYACSAHICMPCAVTAITLLFSM